MGKQLIEGAQRTTGFRVSPEDLTIIGLDTKHKSQAEHRRFDKRIFDPLDEDTVENIVAIGVQVSIMVEVEEIDGKERYVVVDGRGRTRMAREANKRLKKKGLPPKMVPVVAARSGDTTSKLHDMVQIALNEHRREDTPWNRAEKAGYMLATGYDRKTVANLFKCSEQTVVAWEKYNQLPQAIRAKVERGELAFSAAVMMHGMSEADAVKHLVTATPEATGDAPAPKATVAQAKAAAKAAKTGGTVVVAPTRRTLAKLIEQGEGKLPEEFIQGLKFARGELSPKDVPGLAKLLKEIEG